MQRIALLVNEHLMLLVLWLVLSSILTLFSNTLTTLSLRLSLELPVEKVDDGGVGDQLVGKLDQPVPLVPED